MIRHIVNSTILENCLTLIGNKEKVMKEYKQISDKYIDFAHIGNVCEMRSEYFLMFFNNLVENKQNRFYEDMLEEKIAFIFGHLCRMGTDQEMALLNVCSDELRIYHDACIFREYYMNDMDYKSGMKQAELEKLGLTEETAIKQISVLLHALVKRAIIRMHTFKPGYEDIHTWLERFYEKQKGYNGEISAYAKAIVAPDREKVKEYILDTNFYSEEDLIVSVSKKLRNGEKINLDDMKAALYQEPSSVYGKALKNSYEFVEAAGEYLNSGGAIDGLVNALNIKDAI